MYEYFVCIYADINSYSVALLHKLDRVVHLHKIDMFEGVSNNHIVELCTALKGYVDTKIATKHHYENARFAGFYHNELVPIERRLRSLSIGHVESVSTPEVPRFRDLAALIGDGLMVMDAEIAGRGNGVIRQLEKANIDDVSSELNCLMMAIGVAETGIHVPMSIGWGIVIR
jgi:hypothetical protein